MAQPGYFDTTIGANGTPITIPTLTTLMNNWIAWTENQSVLSLDNQGETGPAAVGAMCLQVAQNYISTFFNLFNPIPPDATMTTAATFQARIVFEAGFVAAAQWNPNTFSINIASTIAQAVAAAQAVVVIPPTPLAGARVGQCFQGPNGIICAPGPGSTLQNTVNGMQYINSGTGGDGKPYLAHIGPGPGAIGQQIWYTPGNSTGAPPNAPMPSATPVPTAG